MLALVDPDSDLHDRLRETGRAVVHLLGWEHRDLAEAFAGTAPAPGGPFRTGGLRADGVGAAAGRRRPPGPAVSLETVADVGWSALVTCVVDEVTIGDDLPPLVHRRGRYLRPSEG